MKFQIEKWRMLHKCKRHRIKYPSEIIVRFNFLILFEMKRKNQIQDVELEDIVLSKI